MDLEKWDILFDAELYFQISSIDATQVSIPRYGRRQELETERLATTTYKTLSQPCSVHLINE